MQSNRNKTQRLNKLKRRTLDFANSQSPTLNINKHYSAVDGATNSPNPQETIAEPHLHKQDRPQRQRNIFIISSNKRNNVLMTARSTVQNTKICYYLSPNIGLQQLLVNLENKMKNCTLQDSCFIMIGEKDFETSKDYRNPFNILRTKLLKIQNTTVFICLPTIRHGLHKYVI